ncbi:Aste57867_14684 [Aphanomyces stellatus]|uniref:Aste57867_14684 protein n=1 Tax=Aphanomyces stellatus TaxID=120398 RepID=A0A485L1M6_9STRA|nr:hypothetical protein As57867_014629 [Aphanomyces stellatus]VFT91502.1 Aste57867_14684 [Aphanomyces stellatus]
MNTGAADAAGSGARAPQLSAIGRALYETSLSMASSTNNPSRATATGTPSSSAGGKRERTDSLKQMLPSPAAQRAKGKGTAKPAPIVTTNLDVAPDSAPNSLSSARGAGGDKSNPRRWSKAEDESLRLAVERSGERNWKAIADQVVGRNHTQCLQRWTKVLKPGLIKGHWTPEEDGKLRALVAEGRKNWGQVASHIPGRTSKQCRERWCNHLDPNINKGYDTALMMTMMMMAHPTTVSRNYTREEDQLIVDMQAKLGNRWSVIAQQLTGRTEDAVKIRWKSLMRTRRTKDKGGDDNADESPSDDDDAATYPPAPSPPEKKPPTPQQANTPQVKGRTKAKAVKTAAAAPASQTFLANNHVVRHPSVTAAATKAASSKPTPSRPSYPMPPSSMLARPLDANNGGGHHHHHPEMLHRSQSTPSPYLYPPPPRHDGRQLSGGYHHPSSSRDAQHPPPLSYLASNYASKGGYPRMAPPPSTYASMPYGNLPPPPSSSSYEPSLYMQPPQHHGHHHNHPSAAYPHHPMHGPPHHHHHRLHTPREEWGTSHTPRSQVLSNEGQATDYELFHQQRLRLMVQERERAGPTLSPAASPGQAMLTKELEANNERQAIMQNGWRHAAHATASTLFAADLGKAPSEYDDEHTTSYEEGFLDTKESHHDHAALGDMDDGADYRGRVALPPVE